MSSSKKIDLQRDFAADDYMSEAQNPIPPPPYTLYTCIQYTYSHREGGREESWTREKVRGARVHKARSKYQRDWLYLQPINSDKYLPQSPYTCQSF